MASTAALSGAASMGSSAGMASTAALSGAASMGSSAGSGSMTTSVASANPLRTTIVAPAGI